MQSENDQPRSINSMKRDSKRFWLRPSSELPEVVQMRLELRNDRAFRKIHASDLQSSTAHELKRRDQVCITSHQHNDVCGTRFGQGHHVQPNAQVDSFLFPLCLKVVVGQACRRGSIGQAGFRALPSTKLQIPRRTATSSSRARLLRKGSPPGKTLSFPEMGRRTVPANCSQS